VVRGVCGIQAAAGNSRSERTVHIVNVPGFLRIPRRSVADGQLGPLLTVGLVELENGPAAARMHL
jgi:hypothetical protein